MSQPYRSPTPGRTRAINTLLALIMLGCVGIILADRSGAFGSSQPTSSSPSTPSSSTSSGAPSGNPSSGDAAPAQPSTPARNGSGVDVPDLAPAQSGDTQQSGQTEQTAPTTQPDQSQTEQNQSDQTQTDQSQTAPASPPASSGGYGGIK